MKSREFHLICKTCGKEFIAKTSNIKYCSEECEPKVRCDNCGKLFRIVRDRGGKHFCSRSCVSQYKEKHLTKEQKERRSEIARENIKKANEYWRTEEGRKRKSEICAETNRKPERAALVSKQWENKDFRDKMTKAIIERWQKGVYGTLALDNLEKLNSRHIKYCEVCNRETIHNGFETCLVCHPNTGGKHKGNSIFKEIEGKLNYFDFKNNKYVPWNEYKEKFIKNNKNIDFNLPDGFEIIPTFRTQDSQDWSGARIAFEQNLVDLGVNWFVYVKFYVDSEGMIKPLVVGKSGSLLVNSNGSDVNFSEDVNHGPARRFINETEGVVWCKTKIAICKCKTEQEALKLEKELQCKYNLFGS